MRYKATRPLPTELQPQNFALQDCCSIVWRPMRYKATRPLPTELQPQNFALINFVKAHGFYTVLLILSN